MRYFIVFLTLISSIFCVNRLLFPSHDDHQIVSVAVASLAEKFFIEHSIYFGILVYGDTSNHLNDVIHEFLDRMNTQNYGVYLRNMKKIHNIKLIEVHYPLIVFMLNEDALMSFKKAARYNYELQVDMKILIYLDEDVQAFSSHRKFEYDNAELLAYFYYIRNEKYQISFFTHEYFNENQCNEVKSVTINTLDKKLMQWISPLDNYNKFQNFYGCELVLVEKFGPLFNFKGRNQEIIDCVLKDYPFCNNLMYFISEETQPQGLFVDLIRMTSKIANFTPNFKMEVTSDMIKRYNLNEKNPVIKLTVGSFYRDLGFRTSLLFESNFLMAATPSEFYTNYEKLWLPFDDVTWILLLLTFLAAFSIIFVAKYLTNSIQSLIIGREVSTPALNVIQIFFGYSQMKLPAASVPRFILMLFILFCLIFRTCYQSKLFEFMTSDMRKPPPSTIEDLIERNYKILTCDQGHLNELMEVIHGDEIWKNVIIFNDCSKIFTIYCRTYDNASEKLAFFIEDTQFASYNSLCKGAAVRLRNFKGSSSPAAVYTTHSSFIYRHFNLILEKIIPAGIPQYLFDYNAFMLFKEYQAVVDSGPKVLTLNDLSFGFVLWLGACGISIIGFLLEILTIKIKKLAQELFGLLGFLSILFAFQCVKSGL